jgi:Protein of unknown function (DUF732)
MALTGSSFQQRASGNHVRGCKSRFAVRQVTALPERKIPPMFTGAIGHSSALVTTIVVLTGAAILRGAAAAADSNQDDQFLALLDQEGIPALGGVPSLIDTAHKVCRTLDAGMSADGLVDAMVNDAYRIDPSERQYAPGRLARTEARFITAAVGAYCPYDQGKIASIRANPTGWNRSTHRVAADVRNAVNARSDLREPPLLASLIGAVPSGEITDPDPPQIAAPPPPAAQIQTPRRPMAPPPPPKRPPPPPQQPPPPPQQPPPPPQLVEPPPQQVEPPAVGPQPGGAPGSDGGGSTGGNGGGGNRGGGNGGGGPADPSPGFVRLAP